MKLGAFLKQYLKQSLQAFKHPKQMLPTIILTVVWIILGLLQIKLKENLPMKLLNFITYAQGGLYGGVVGAIGGILGKVVVAGFVNALIAPLFMGKKPFSGLGNGFKELGKSLCLQSRKALAPFLKGIGSALLLYVLFNFTGRMENSMAGIMAAVSIALAMGKKNGFLWNFACSYAQSVTKGKTPDYTSILRALTGMTLGFSLGVALAAIGTGLVSLLGIIALLAGWILGMGTKKEAVATILLAMLTLIPVKSEARGGSKDSFEADFYYDQYYYDQDCKGHIKITGDDYIITIPKATHKVSESKKYDKEFEERNNISWYETVLINDIPEITIKGRCRVEQKVTSQGVQIYVYPTGDYTVTPNEVTFEEKWTRRSDKFITYGWYKYELGDRNGRDRAIREGWKQRVEEKHNISTYLGGVTVKSTIKGEENYIASFNFLDGKEPTGGLFLKLLFNKLHIKYRNYSYKQNGEEKEFYDLDDWHHGYARDWQENTYSLSEVKNSNDLAISIGDDLIKIKTNIKLGTIAKAEKKSTSSDEKEKSSGSSGRSSVFEDDTHADEEKTIIQDLIAGLLAGGAAAGAGAAGAAGGGPFGGDFPGGGEGPEGGKSEEEKEWERQMKEYEKWEKGKLDKYTRKNPDGTINVTDPSTGKTSVFYPKEGGGYENENGTSYSNNDLANWLDDRERNSEYYKENAATAEKNLEDWRKRNDELKDMDREAYNKAKAEREQQYKKEDYENMLRDKYLNGGAFDAKAIKKEILKERQAANKDYAEATEWENRMDELINQTKLVQDTCDALINVGANYVEPGGALIRDAYSLAKGAAARGADAAARGKSWKEIGKSAGAGLVEGSVDVLKNHVDDMVDFVGDKLPSSITDAVGETVKEVISDTVENVGTVFFAGTKQVISSALDGKKPAEIVKDVKETCTKEVINIGIGKVVEKVGEKAVTLTAKGMTKMELYKIHNGTLVVDVVDSMETAVEAMSNVWTETQGGQVTDFLYENTGDVIKDVSDKAKSIKSTLRDRARKKYGEKPSEKK